MRTLLLFSSLAAICSASSLNVCGISDGGAGDIDGTANGSISANCAFAGGSFSGTVTENPTPMTHHLGVRGIFQGTGSFTINGVYDIAMGDGTGDFYPYIKSAGTLASSVPGGTVSSAAYLQFGGATVHPLFAAGTALPAPMSLSMGGGIVHLIPGLDFPGPHSYSITLSWNAGSPDYYFDFPAGLIRLQISTDPNRPIPEPSPAGVLGGALLLLWVTRASRAKWHT